MKFCITLLYKDIGKDDIATFEGVRLNGWKNKCNSNMVVLKLDPN